MRINDTRNNAYIKCKNDDMEDGSMSTYNPFATRNLWQKSRFFTSFGGVDDDQDNGGQSPRGAFDPRKSLFADAINEVVCFQGDGDVKKLKKEKEEGREDVMRGKVKEGMYRPGLFDSLSLSLDLDVRGSEADENELRLGPGLVEDDIGLGGPFEFGQGLGLDAVPGGVSPPESDHVEGFSLGHTDQREEEGDLWQWAMKLDNDMPKLRTWDVFLAEERRMQGTGSDENRNEEEKAESSIKYVSEAGDRVFDGLLERLYSKPSSNRHGRGRQGAGDVLQSAFYLKCLALLGSGRSSALFQWNESDKNKTKRHGYNATFTQTLPNVRFSGVSLMAAEGIVEQLGRIGGLFVKLRRFVDGTYASKDPLAARVALARCVQVILEVLEQELASNVPGAKSTLQLVSHFETTGVVLHDLSVFVDNIRSARSDTEAIQLVQKDVWDLENSCSPYSAVYLDILHRVGRPWMQDISERVGLSIRKSDNVGTAPELTGMVSDEDQEVIDDLVTGLGILHESDPDHPLLTPATWGVQLPDIDAAAYHLTAEEVLGRVNRYEEELRKVIGRYDAGARQSAIPKTPETGDSDLGDDDECMAWEDNEHQQVFFANLGDRFSQMPDQRQSSSTDQSDSLRSRVTSAIQQSQSLRAGHSNNDLLSHTADVLSSQESHNRYALLGPLQPYLQAQSSILNITIMRLLFGTYGLRHHLNIQHSFHLFGNGLFTYRLSLALFDADSTTAQRRTGSVIGKEGGGAPLGLRLDSRGGQKKEDVSSSSSWPPGGSELRLALMGVLSESCQPASVTSNNGIVSAATATTEVRKIDNFLSFSIRNIPTDAEIQRILDPNSIHALDFLRLSYEAPRPLDTVFFTANIMSDYDDVFRFVLGVVRMVHVVVGLRRLVVASPSLSPSSQAAAAAAADANTTSKAAQAYAMYSHAFITSLAAYIFDIGIAEPWGDLMRAVDETESFYLSSSPSPDSNIDDETPHPKRKVKTTLSDLQKLHQRTLSAIRTRLFLRSRHRKLRDAIERVFAAVLEVWSRLRSSSSQPTSASATRSRTFSSAPTGKNEPKINSEDMHALRGAIERFIAALGKETARAKTEDGRNDGNKAREKTKAPDQDASALETKEMGRAWEMLMLRVGF